MTTYTGTQTVEAGLYYTMWPFTLTTMDQNGPLPGADDRIYHRVPMMLMLALAPLLGLAFVIFLPLIGFVMVARIAGEKATGLAGQLATQGARVLQPAWAPARAFLTRAKAAKPHAAAPAVDRWAEDTARTLAETDTAADTVTSTDTHQR